MRPVFAWTGIFPNEGRGALEWLARAHGPEAVASLYAYAISAYSNAPVAFLDPYDAIFPALVAASNASVPQRVAAASIASAYGLRLSAYEGSLVAEPSSLALSNETTARCIAANRDARFGAAMVVDIEQNWAPLGGAEFNFFALSGPYGPDPPPWCVGWAAVFFLRSLSFSTTLRSQVRLPVGPHRRPAQREHGEAGRSAQHARPSAAHRIVHRAAAICETRSQSMPNPSGIHHCHHHGDAYTL